AEHVERVAVGTALEGHPAHAEGVEGDRRRGQAGEGADVAVDVQHHVGLGERVVRVVHVHLAEAVAVEVDDVDRGQDLLRAEPLAAADVDGGDVELAVHGHRLDRGRDVDRVEVTHAGPHLDQDAIGNRRVQEVQV